MWSVLCQYMYLRILWVFCPANQILALVFNLPLHFRTLYSFEEGTGLLHTVLSFGLMLHKCFLNPRSQSLKEKPDESPASDLLLVVLIFTVPCVWSAEISLVNLHWITMDLNFLRMCSSQHPFPLTEDLELWSQLGLSHILHINDSL